MSRYLKWNLDRCLFAMGREVSERFADDESGATAIEYALLVALLGVSIATTLVTIGNPVRFAFEIVFNALSAI